MTDNSRSSFDLTDQELRLESLRFARNLPQIFSQRDLIKAASDIEDFIRNGKSKPVKEPK